MSLEDNMSRKVQHVVPRNGKWAVRKEGSDRVSRYFDTQSEAIDVGRDIAQRQRTEVYIHGSDGRIRERNSYGNDPFPPSVLLPPLSLPNTKIF